MPMVSRTGTYLARPISWGLKHEDGKCPRFAMIFACESLRVGGAWEAVQGDERITGYFTLFNKDGSPNEINLRALHDALGWDGASISSLENGNWADAQVQIVVGEHEYQGETTLEVKYLNPKDYAGGIVQKADPRAVQSLDQKYGATLRALFAKQGANGRKEVMFGPSDDTVDGAKQAAWKVFIDKTPTYNAEKRAEIFRKVVTSALPPGTDPKSCTAEQWRGVRQQIEKDFSEATEGLIPF